MSRNFNIRDLYPYTNFHELNLDWILDKIQEFQEELATFEDYGDRITALETFTDKLQADLTAFKNTYYSFVNTQQSTNRALQSQIRDNNNLITSLKSYTLNLEKELKAEDRRINERVDVLVHQYNLVLQDIANIRLLIAQGDDRTLQLAKIYADGLIEEFKQEFPQLYDLYVYSPISGQLVTVQEALNEIYAAYRYLAITAYDFDRTGWTAQELDSMGYTAEELDTLGKELLARKELAEWMIRNPWYGDFVDFKTVLYQLIGYHVPTLNCYQRDLRELTAEELDNKEYSAYYLDWGLDWKFYQTCQQRDDMQYTAQALDDLELTAYTYDSEGGFM